MNNIPLVRSRRERGDRRRKLPSAASSLSSFSLRKRAKSPYTIVLCTIFILGLCYMMLVLSWLFVVYPPPTSSTSAATNLDSNIIQDPHQLLNNNNNNNNNYRALEPHLQFDSHNFLHEPRRNIDTITDIISPQQQQQQQQQPQINNNNTPPLIHIVHTRFMQHQGSLVHLAQARLHLFQTFCLPTMIHQSNTNFLWFIQVDPQLHLSIINALIQLVKPYPHIFIIATLVNYWIGPEKNGSWRNGIEGTEIWSHVYQDQVFSGNLDLILTAMELEQTSHPIILETRLDADDGLNTRFIENIQRDALNLFTFTNPKFRPEEGKAKEDLDEKKSISPPQWLYWCSRHYLVWFYESKRKEDLGSVELREMMEDECITPGLTVGLNRYTRYEDVPQHDHNQLYRRILGDSKGCGADSVQECIRFLKDVSSSTDHHLSQGLYLSAVRARTLTSAGMKDVTPSAAAVSLLGASYAESQSSLWSILQSTNFFISTSQVMETRAYIQAHIVDIAKENLEGQCRGKHSCKESSQILLQKMIDTGSTNVTLFG